MKQKPPQPTKPEGSPAKAAPRSPRTSLEVRKLFESRGFIYPKTTYAFVSLNSDASKTELAYSVALRSYQLGCRVLCLDFDPNATLSKLFRIEASEKRSFWEMMTENLSLIQGVVGIAEGFGVIPSNRLNANLVVANDRTLKTNFIRDRLQEIKGMFDLVFIDAPIQSEDTLLKAICGASDTVLAPIQTDIAYATEVAKWENFFALAQREVRTKFEYHWVTMGLNKGQFWPKFPRDIFPAGFESHLYPVPLSKEAMLTTPLRDDCSLFDSLDLPQSLLLDPFTKELIGMQNWIDSRRMGHA